MSIVTRLVLLASLVGALLIGAGSLALLRFQEDQLRAAEQDEMTLVGRAVAVSAGNALRDAQLSDVVETISGLSRVDPDLQVLIFAPSGALVARSEGVDGPDAAARVLVDRALDSRAVAVRWVPPAAPEVLLLAEPLVDDGGRLLGAVVVRRPLDGMQAHLSATRRSLVGGLVAFVAVAGLTIWVSARATVGKPLDALLAAIRAVQGDRLDVRLDVRRGDELGAIARAFNEMADALGEARERLAAEQEHRRALADALARADKLATIGQMTASIAHEVASPLQAVLGHAEQLVERADQPDRVRRHGDVILRHTGRVIDVMRRMLDFVRRPVGHGRPYDPRRAVDDVLELVTPELRRRGIGLTVEDAGAPLLVGEPQEMQQVVLNLIHNALAASDAGQRVTVALAPGEHAFAPGVPPEPVLVLEVRDDGAGLPPGDPEQLFEPFVSHRGEGGTGLGLAVVRWLVQRRGGTVRAERRDRGSVFRVLLPAARAAERRAV